ncbi:MAG TPA: peptidoglycan DD-metalloendopeptidase family protein [Mariprofundaceae bacterium]|nr:peptidoglycan DD-metalloendopeptidase family protein [Mariprofundaceae bacterium]
MHKLVIFTGFAALAISGLVMLMGNSQEVAAKASMPHEEWLSADLTTETSESTVQKEQLKAGDTAVGIFERFGYSASETADIIDAARKAYPLHNVRAGQTFSLVKAGNSANIYYDIDSSSRLHLIYHPESNSWQGEVEQRGILNRRVFTSGTIEGSLFEAAAKAGLSERTTMNLVDIFAWDIDFARDIRKGDSFRVAYEERYDDDGKSLGSVILAAEFVNQGELFQAVRYEKPNGDVEYFTPEGKSLRKSYLKAPLKFTRISSTFQLKRMHPILGYTRAHKGVDYAAPTGTPISAVGDGRIVFCGWKSGYGRFIEIRHTNGEHTTAYGHMSRFARGIHAGSRVRQGQVIGYVGMSGLATGPHLHFEFRVRGQAVNPLTIKRSPADPIPVDQMAAFREQTTPLLAELNETNTLLAWE